MAVYAESAFPIEIGFGLYTAELPSGLPNGYCFEAYNTIGSGESMENRLGFNYAPVNYYIEQAVTQEHSGFSVLYMDNPTLPVLGWVDGNYLCFIRGSARLQASTPSGDGFMRWNAGTGICYSLAQYGTVTYYSTAGGVYKITSYNWTTDVPTVATISTTVNSLFGMITFKDRMWGFKGNTLFFTNPATVTTLPETWSAVTQAIPVEGPNGSGDILKVIPIGARLLIFTTNGLYALTVQGEPASWIFKVLDNKSMGSHRQCAFEKNNLVYFVNMGGVYVTDGYEVTKLSTSIDDKFSGSVTGSVRYSLNFLNDGMVLNMCRYFNSAGTLYYDAPYGKTFYTKLDTIAWTEWDLGTHQQDVPGVFDTQKLAAIISTSDSLYTFLSPDPLSFLLLVVGKSTEAVPANSVFQLCTYDGHMNALKTNNPGYPILEEEIHLKVRTGFSDFGDPWNLKNIKYAFAEVFTNDPEYDFETWWIIDNSTDVEQKMYTQIVGTTPGEGTNLVKIVAGFMTRRASLSFHAYLQNVESQMKFKNFVAILHQERREFKEIR